MKNNETARIREPDSIIQGLNRFTSAFKKQMVGLFENGKSRAAIVAEYDLTASALDRWIKQAQTTGSFKEKDNRSSEDNERIA